MTHSKGYGVSGWGIGVLAVSVLAGCGGSVDLSSDGNGGRGGVGSSGGSGTTSGAAGSTTAPDRVKPGPVVGAVAASVVDDGVVLGAGKPTDGVFAFDANPHGAGRAVYLSSLETPDCALRVTSPSVQAKQPAFSPDRTHLAYAAQTDGTYQIHELNLQSGVVEQLTDLPFGATAPAYSPNGQRLAFLTGDSDSYGSNPVEGLHDVMVLDLAEQTQQVVLSTFELGCCSSNVRIPTFFTDDEIALSNATELVVINLKNFNLRRLMPWSSRIPNPQDPSPSPDGVRYVYADRCDGILSLYIGRLDGSSGDSCKGAARIPLDIELFGTDWGPNGYIAAIFPNRVNGVVLIDDQSYALSEPSSAKGGRNPAWAKGRVDLALDCE
jgi:hypothetical protein